MPIGSLAGGDRVGTKEPERFKLDPLHQMPGLISARGVRCTKPEIAKPAAVETTGLPIHDVGLLVPVLLTPVLPALATAAALFVLVILIAVLAALFMLLARLLARFLLILVAGTLITLILIAHADSSCG
jgi:hypothetical protein